MTITTIGYSNQIQPQNTFTAYFLNLVFIYCFSYFVKSFVHLASLKSESKPNEVIKNLIKNIFLIRM